jgi:methionine-rich copper-binding protein CopC
MSMSSASQGWTPSKPTSTQVSRLKSAECHTSRISIPDSPTGATGKVRIQSRRAVGNSQTTRRSGVVVTALVIGALLLGTMRAESQPMDTIASSPKAHEVVDGSMVSISLRLDAPVDHERSTLLLKSDQGVRELKPRLESGPKYLFSIVGHLMPGAYELVWKAQLSDGRTTSGTIPFTVK